jgi:threonine/homoserine/homoserine lactone efflux protein
MTNPGAFFVLAVALAVVPGPDTTIVTRNALIGGRPRALGTIFGVATGNCVWVLTSALGVAAVLRESAPAFTALKVAGAVYLTVVGLRSLWTALRRREPNASQDPAVHGQRGRVAFRQGLVTNLGNAKTAIFFTSLLPQFASASHPSFGVLLLLGAVFASIGLTALTTYGLLAARLSIALRRPRPRRVMEAISGVVFLGFGLRLATEHT